MICRLCLSNTEQYFGFFDSYGLSVSAVDIIFKHFSFQPKIDDRMSNFICLECWQIVKQFHNLFKIVEKTNKILSENNLIHIKSDPGEIVIENNQNINEFNMSEIENKDNEFDWENIDFDKINTDLKIEKTDISENDKTFGMKSESKFLKTESEELHNVDLKKNDAVLKEENIQDNLEIMGIKSNNLKKEKHEEFPNIRRNTLRKNRHNRKISLQALAENKKEENKNDSFLNARDHQNILMINDLKKIQSNDKLQSNIKLIEEDERIASFMKMICVLCESECNNFSSLRWHFITKHKQKGFVICCDKKFFKRSVLVDHVEKHINPESFKCNLCNKICISRWTLKLHVSRVHESTEAGHQCTFCGKSFKLKTILTRHQLIHMPEEEKKFECKECGKRYPSKGTLSSHIRAYHDRRYAGICDICGKTYNNKEDVRRHRLEVHEGIARKNIKCKLCSKEFTTKYQYNIHKVEEHGDPTKKIEHRCLHCDKISANSEALKRHVQKVHKAKLKFFCNFCDKVFKTDLSLKEHQTTHTGEPLYICPHCPRTFTHNSNMHHHRKRAHPVEFEQARQHKSEKKESWMQITAFP